MFSKIISIFDVMMVIVVVSYLKPVHSNSCKEPDMSKLHLDVDDLHDSFYRLPSMKKHIVNTAQQSQYVAIHHGYMHGPKKCPTWDEVITRYGGHICPVYYVLNHDENRIPKSFVEARCSCRRARTENATQGESIYQCAPLTKYTKVQRRIGCNKNNTFIYSPMWEIVQIGCATQMPEIRESKKPNVKSDGK